MIHIILLLAPPRRLAIFKGTTDLIRRSNYCGVYLPFDPLKCLLYNYLYSINILHLTFLFFLYMQPSIITLHQHFQCLYMGAWRLKLFLTRSMEFPMLKINIFETEIF
jgi:hypothetical protein